MKLHAIKILEHSLSCWLQVGTLKNWAKIKASVLFFSPPSFVQDTHDSLSQCTPSEIDSQEVSVNKMGHSKSLDAGSLDWWFQIVNTLLKSCLGGPVHGICASLGGPIIKCY